MLPRPPCSTLFPTRRSSDLSRAASVPRTAWDRSKRLRARPAADARPRRNRSRSRHDHARQSSRHARYDPRLRDRKSTRLNSSHVRISYAVFCLKKKKKKIKQANLNIKEPKLHTLHELLDNNKKDVSVYVVEITNHT